MISTNLLQEINRTADEEGVSLPQSHNEHYKNSRHKKKHRATFIKRMENVLTTETERCTFILLDHEEIQTTKEIAKHFKDKNLLKKIEIVIPNYDERATQTERIQTYMKLDGEIERLHETYPDIEVKLEKSLFLDVVCKLIYNKKQVHGIYGDFNGTYFKQAEDALHLLCMSNYITKNEECYQIIPLNIPLFISFTFSARSRKKPTHCKDKTYVESENLYNHIQSIRHHLDIDITYENSLEKFQGYRKSYMWHAEYVLQSTSLCYMDLETFDESLRKQYVKAVEYYKKYSSKRENDVKNNNKKRKLNEKTEMFYMNLKKQKLNDETEMKTLNSIYNCLSINYILNHDYNDIDINDL